MNSQIKERPILFSEEMVRAILDGRKTMTRRVIKPQPGDIHTDLFKINYRCPYGWVGDRLWVRETYWLFENVPFYKADGMVPLGMSPFVKWKPSIFMPRCASRITLEITGVRVEGIKDINIRDMAAEGVSSNCPMLLNQKFRDLWDSINAKRGYGFDVNPWVWVVEFKKL